MGDFKKMEQAYKASSKILEKRMAKQIQMIEGKNDFENGVISVLRLGLASIGPEEILIKEHKPFFFNPTPTLYDLKDSLKYNFEMIFFVKSSFKPTIPGIPNLE